MILVGSLKAALKFGKVTEMQADPSGPETQDSDYWAAKAIAAREQELSQVEERTKEIKEAGQARSKKAKEQLNDWTAAVEMRDKRRRNIGLTLAGVGVLAGILLLFWASRLQLGSFPEKILDGLGTAMLVAATVEVAARLIRNLVSVRQRKAEEDRDKYLQWIRDDVTKIGTDLEVQLIKREAAELDAQDAENARRKAFWEDARDKRMAPPSMRPAEESVLQVVNGMLETIPPVPDSYYYSAKADLQHDREMKELRRHLGGGKPGEGSD